jgi:ribosomal protein S18
MIPDKASTSIHTYSFWAIVFLFLITLTIRVLLIFFYNSNYGGIDMNVIYGMQQILSGNSLYQNPEAPPYAIMQYTPLFYLLSAGIAQMFSVTADNVQGIYEIARALALICNLLTVWVVSKTIRIQGGDKLSSTLFALPALIILTTHYYVRCDSMHLCFFALAIYALTAWIQSQKSSLLLLMILSTALCIASKQSGVLVAGITGFYLLFLKRSIKYTILYTIGVLICCALILHLSIEGNWILFYQNAVLGLKNGTSTNFLVNMFFSRFFTELIPFYILGGILVWASVRHATKDKQFQFTGIAIALSFLFAVITGLKIGSSSNYFVEYLLLCFIGIPQLLSHSSAQKVIFQRKGKTYTIKTLTWLAIFILLGSKTMGLFGSIYLEKRMISRPYRYENLQALHRYITDTLRIAPHRYVFSNERGFADNIFYKEALMPTKDVVSQVVLSNPEVYNFQSFISGMNQGLIQYIIAPQDNPELNRFQQEIPFLQFDSSRFVPLEEKYGYLIYAFQ